MFLWLSGGGCAAVADKAPAIPAAAAARIFSEAHKLCAADHGKLWGRTLCGPMMFTDPASRTAVLNEPIPNAAQDGKVWRITLPKSFLFANTALPYKGRRWSMVEWSMLPADKTERDIMLMHESYHRIQPALGLTSKSADNGHLDTRRGRIWLRAEFHALRAALKSTGDARKRALADALRFRVYRRSLWPHAAKKERALELNEGLANSTGIELALQTQGARIKASIDEIKAIENKPSYVRSFAYATGPAYGELLNSADPGWHRRVTPAFDFSKTAAKAYGLKMPSADKAAAMQALGRYDGKEVIAQEDRRAKKIKARNARYRQEFIAGSTVTFPVIHSSKTFNPSQVMHFPGHGNVYSTLHVTDDWGELTVKGGDALISSGSGHIILPITHKLTGDHLNGKGWSAVLKGSFRLAPDPHKPDSYVVKKMPIGR
jgi:hypothetical protein